MSSLRTEPIILSGKQFADLAESLRRPDEGYMKIRDEIFAKMDKDISIKQVGRDLEVDIPDLDLSFIEKETRDGQL